MYYVLAHATSNNIRVNTDGEVWKVDNDEEADSQSVQKKEKEICKTKKSYVQFD